MPSETGNTVKMQAGFAYCIDDIMNSNNCEVCTYIHVYR